MKIDIKCVKHPRYQAKRYPSADGCSCWLIYHLLNDPQKVAWTDHIKVTSIEEQCSEHQMLERVRDSLYARSEGLNEGGDIEVMFLVDKIIEREGSK